MIIPDKLNTISEGNRTILVKVDPVRKEPDNFGQIIHKNEICINKNDENPLNRTILDYYLMSSYMVELEKLQIQLLRVREMRKFSVERDSVELRKQKITKMK